MNSINHPDLRHTSSCRDVTSAFFYVKDVWNQLGWSETLTDPSESAPARPHLAAVVKVIKLFKAEVTIYQTYKLVLKDKIQYYFISTY